MLFVIADILDVPIGSGDPKITFQPRSMFSNRSSKKLVMLSLSNVPTAVAPETPAAPSKILINVVLIPIY